MSITEAIANHIVAVTAIVLSVSWFIIWTILDQWRKARTAEQNAVLKKSMIDKGFTPEAIIRVVEAGAEPDECGSNDLMTQLVDGDYSGEDITNITAAMDRCPAKVKPEVQRAVAKMVGAGYDGGAIVTFIDGRIATATEGATPESAYAR